MVAVPIDFKSCLGSIGTILFSALKCVAIFFEFYVLNKILELLFLNEAVNVFIFLFG